MDKIPCLRGAYILEGRHTNTTKELNYDSFEGDKCMRGWGEGGKGVE